MGFLKKDPPEDAELVKELFNQLKVDIGQPTLHTKLGRARPDEKPGILRVTLQNDEFKMKFLRNAPSSRQVRNLSFDIASVYARQDMTE